jgi:hypothetical protein
MSQEEKNEKNEDESDIAQLIIGGFSTNNNNEKKSLKSLIKAFSETKENSEIKYNNNSQYELTYKILNENGNTFSCKNIFIEIKLSEKNLQIYTTIDCYIIFLDLENNESLIEIGKILNYLTQVDTDINYKKIYLINFFTNQNNIQSNLTEENIKLYFNKYELENYDISDLDLTDSNNELVKIIESISVETLEDKNIINDGIVINRQKDFLNDGKDRSKCFIF